jgi:hypothetical protein
VNDINEVRQFTLFNKFYGQYVHLKKGENTFVCQIESMPLKPGDYLIELFLGTDYATLDYYKEPLLMEILSPSDIDYILPDSSQGNYLIHQKWL